MDSVLPGRSVPLPLVCLCALALIQTRLQATWKHLRTAFGAAALPQGVALLALRR